MNVTQALAQLTGPIHAEFAAAVENRWQASEREHRANQKQTEAMREASRVLRAFIRRLVEPHLGAGQSIDFNYEKNADCLIRWDTKPAVRQPAVSFRIYLGDHMELGWAFVPVSEDDLAARMSRLCRILDAVYA